MLRNLVLVGSLAVVFSLSGCGEGKINELPPDAGTPDYAKRTADQMKTAYGVPKVEKGGPVNPADLMKKMYGTAAGK